MYKVVTTITPIQYATKLNNVADCYNSNHSTKITNLDIAALQALNDARRAMRKTPLMHAARGRVHAQRFDKIIDRLLDLRYISSTKHKRATYYSITIAGRQALTDLNGILIHLVAQSIAANK